MQIFNKQRVSATGDRQWENEKGFRSEQKPTFEGGL